MINLTRLMVLGLLASHGPRHGHEIRRQAEQANVANWGGISVGALYRELRQMHGLQLVETVRTEREGRRPTRTIYRITEEGTRELSALRAHAIRELHFGPDAFGVALLFGQTWGRKALVGLLNDRRRALAEAREGLKATSAQLETAHAIGPIDVALFRRRGLQVEAELRWHDEFDRVLATLPDQGQGQAPRARRGGSAPTPVPDSKPFRGERKSRI